jgi:hypothetical protein
MDESCAPFTPLGEQGCNHCLAARLREVHNGSKPDLESLLGAIKRGQGSDFDCVIGVSGGLDSSYLLAKSVELGLRPLAVHMDNNWNSSMASRNIRRLLDKLNVPLITVVTDWQTQKNLQLAFIGSDVIDVELLYDNALHSVCYGVARQFGIKTILGGANNATEGVEIPTSWSWRKFDGRNIRSIAKNSGIKTAGYPIFSTLEWLYSTLIARIKWTSLLDSMPEYGREEALSYLTANYGYTPYGNKHYENVFTRFYQGHILPTKFGIDKRKPHLSSEIIAGKITRDEALTALQLPIYETKALLELDYNYVVSKLGMTGSQMEDYLSRAAQSHSVFKRDRVLELVIPSLLWSRRKLLELLGKMRQFGGRKSSS